ncbi:hypothetical protein H6790_00945 [Candidatus Nomurabacteria bacterium]|nr:hypothetical protein [Candidatus Nomurabacteria bacterium]
MRNIKQYKEKLVDEGFKHVFEWRDRPGTIYEIHAHKDRVSFYLLDGDLTFEFDDEKVHIQAPTRYDVAPGREHSAIVGKNGAYYVVGEMIEGDS